ncbi:hypothetical protein DM02DRAFT_651679 [Periconia macrospinosa]|uniref:Uncharacterized protein n=1 Tax=Periconia macrospinosa TaxID=97972 RepID=A0A2V1E185_9PLEO|nr:hypothetical protein DM02DRAFT_651679 [Periconia macrospinosa]
MFEAAKNRINGPEEHRPNSEEDRLAKEDDKASKDGPEAERKAKEAKGRRQRKSMSASELLNVKRKSPRPTSSEDLQKSVLD